MAARDIKTMNDKKDVQRFYDSIGWNQKDELYEDSFRFEDMRSVSREYIHKCRLRVKEHIKQTGDYFLDVASGPVPYPEYLDYSANFKQRVCVDLSNLALMEARKKLGERGEYILADITHLPFKDDTFDGVISLHTIYHVPEKEQRNAFSELYRVIKRGNSVIVVYSWGKYSILMFPSTVLWFVIEKIKEKLEKRNIENKNIEKKDIEKKNIEKKNIEKNVIINKEYEESKLYYHPQFLCLMKEFSEFKLEILVSRSVNMYFQKIFIHERLYGRKILNLIFSIENMMPRIAGFIGQYPLILIRK